MFVLHKINNVLQPYQSVGQKTPRLSNTHYPYYLIAHLTTEAALVVANRKDGTRFILSVFISPSPTGRGLGWGFIREDNTP